MKKSLFALAILLSLAGDAQPFTQQQYREDFAFFWKTINDYYCYFGKKGIDWNALKPVYAAQIDTVSTRYGFVATLERTLYELYDHHCSLRTNNPDSRRLVPTGADIWAEYISERPTIIEVRKGFGSEKAGVAAGMEIIAVNDQPVAEAIKAFLPHTITIESKGFALRLLLAGDHTHARKFTLKNGNAIADYYADKDGLLLEHVAYPAYVESSSFENIAYIKINNYLYDNALIAKFDSVLDAKLNSKALIIDLRETPSGGNTSVARAILGRFITKESFYQKHEFYNEEKETGIKRSWVEIVSPRGKTYDKPVVVLADHWTGSISEGITIAFDGMQRATVIGTRLAQLNGAVDGFEMPNTKMGFNIATERLYHVNGTPREAFKPAIEVDVSTQRPGTDPIMQETLRFLQKKIK